MAISKIEFGTDGFRGIIAKNFTFDSVEKITKAVASYINDPKKTVLVGYDPRFMADKFAVFCADLLKTFGYKVLLSSRVCPTPVLAYAATITPSCGGAIMFTASHNPCEYLGMKYIPGYGGPATVEITDVIVKNLYSEPILLDSGEVIKKDFAQEYLLRLEELVDFKKIAQAKLSILYDGLYSASIGYFDVLLGRNNVDFLSCNSYYDPLFGGGMPEPIKKYMKNSKDDYLTLANDGDADRYGVIDENGNWVSPNIIMALLLKYLCEKGNKGKLIKTVGASAILDICAKKLGVETVTTPVGFKWLGEAMRENDTILAGEDSGGLSIGAHIPEKDGILANALILEMLANTSRTLVELQKELKNFVGVEFLTDRVDLKLENKEKIAPITNKFASLKELVGYKVKKILNIDGVKLFLDDDKTWILIRPSGTEPLLRFYIESDSILKIEKIKEFIDASV